MITKNFKALMALILQSSDNNTGTVPVKGVNGTTYYATSNLSFPKEPVLNFTDSANGVGVSFGTKGTAATADDYQLGNTITSGLTATLAQSAKMESDGPSSTLKFVVTNTSSSAITIREVGYKQYITVSSTQGSSGSSMVACLLDRTVLASPLTIAAGDSAILNYKLKTLMTGSSGSDTPGGDTPGGDTIGTLAVTKLPNKTSYESGETLDISGIVVTYTASDGTITNVSASCVFSPANGSTLNEDPLTTTRTVTVTYTPQGFTTSCTASFSVSVTDEEEIDGPTEHTDEEADHDGDTLGTLTVTTPPNKVVYNSGETLNTSGIVVTYTTVSGVTSDVTSSCVFSPANGATLRADSATTSKAITVTYTPQGFTEGCTASFNVSIIGRAQSISVTSTPNKTLFAVDETLNYAGLVVTYTDAAGQTHDVTSSCVFDPAAGTALMNSGPVEVSVSYTPSGSSEALTTYFDITIYDSNYYEYDWAQDYGARIEVTTMPTKTQYTQGEPYDYSGIVVTRIGSYGNQNDITDRCTFSPSEGSESWGGATGGTYNKEIVVSFTPIGGTVQFNTRFNVTVVTPYEESIYVHTLPNKITYVSGDLLDLTGMVIYKKNEDGTETNVTSQCTTRPEVGTVLSGPTSGTSKNQYVQIFYNSMQTGFYVTVMYQSQSGGLGTGNGDGDLTSIAAGKYASTSVAIADFPICSYIGSSAFFRAYNLLSVSFPICEYIGQEAFCADKKLVDVDFPMVKTIGSAAFISCTVLTTATFPEALTVSASAFYGCSKLSDVSFPKCTNLEFRAFYDCSNLYSAYFPSVVSMSSAVFDRCTSLKTAEFPMLEAIPSFAFFWCSALESADFPAATYVGVHAFESCIKLRTVSLPNLLSIDATAFTNCSMLTKLILPKCECISGAAFAGCTNLSLISLPVCSYVRSFGSCENLRTLYLLSNSVVTAINSYILAQTPMYDSTYGTGAGYGSIYVPSSLVSAYIEDKNWKYYSRRFVGV